MSIPPTPEQIQEVAAARSLLQTNVLPLSINSQLPSSLSTSTASSSSSSSSSPSISSSSSSSPRPTPHVHGPATPNGPNLCSRTSGGSSFSSPRGAARLMLGGGGGLVGGRKGGGGFKRPRLPAAGAGVLSTVPKPPNWSSMSKTQRRNWHRRNS